MVAKDAYDILLLALAQAYSSQTDVYVMIEQIERDVRNYAVEKSLSVWLTNATTTALLELDTLKLAKIVRGRVSLTPEGILGCQGLELPAELSGLPAALKPYVRKIV